VAADGSGSKLLVGALAANTLLAVVQVAGGLRFGSLALLADSAHQLVDVLGLGLALLGYRLARRPPSGRVSFGWGRADVLGAQASALLLLGTSIVVVIEAIRRLGNDPSIDGGPVVVIAVLGLIVNAGSAALLSRQQGGGMSTRAAVTHLIGDALGSAAVLVAGLAWLVAEAGWVDPVVSILICCWTGWAALALLRDSAGILLEATPPGIEPSAVSAALVEVPGVEAVHHLHVWAIAHDAPALSAHVVLAGEVSLHEAQARAVELRQLVADRFGIHHATFELECHECDEPIHGITADPA
jgi:cobalt-zinc-cadmium efflux system protein